VTAVLEPLHTDHGDVCPYCWGWCSLVGGRGTCDLIEEYIADRAAYAAAPEIWIGAQS
jgi:hypothetical protein